MRKFTYFLIISISLFVLISGCGEDNTIIINQSQIVSTAPRYLTATPAHKKNTLGWQVPENNGSSAITNYKIYRGLSSGGQSFLVKVSANTLSYVDSNLTNGVKYYYYVTALNDVGESNRSNEISSTPYFIPGPPSEPTNFQLSSYNKIVNVSWQPPIDYGGDANIGYKIFKGTNINNLSLLVTVGNTQPHTYIDTNVVLNVQYFYSLSAFNSYGESNRTTTLSISPSTIINPILGTWKLVKMLGHLQDVCLGEIAVFNFVTATLTCPGSASVTKSYTFVNSILTYIQSGISYGVTFKIENGINKMEMRGKGIVADRILTYDKIGN